MKGRIHSFQSLGTVDGPGVRSVVFLQGCPLRCICCHNPDTWDFSGGEEVETEALVQKILRFRTYFGSEGGVTVSGGEPLLQAAFVTELFTKLHVYSIHTALDTSGCVMNDEVEKLLDVTDLVLLDHKYPTEREYREFVGGSLSSTEKFLEKAQEKGIATVLRRVIIPDKTDSKDSVRQLVSVAERHDCVRKIELLPFRNLCAEKYEVLGIEFPLKDTPTPTKEKMEELAALVPPQYR